MMCSEIVLRFILISCLIRSGIGVKFGIDSGLASDINDLLIGLRCPLKLTIATCRNSGETVRFVRHITNGPENFQIKIIDGSHGMVSNPSERNHEAILIDLNCSNTQRILSQMTREMFVFNKIIVFDSSVNNSASNMDDKIQHLFHDQPVFPMSQVFFISERFPKNRSTVNEVYRTGINQPLIMQDFPIFDVKPTDLTLALRRRNLRGFHFVGTFVIKYNNTYNHLDDFRYPAEDTLSKVGYLMTNVLMQFLNTTITHTNNETWGYYDKESGRWSGVIGQIVEERSHIGVSPVVLTSDRIPFVEYILRPAEAVVVFVFRAPRLSVTNNIFTLPFEGLLWICLGILVLFMIMCLGIAVMIELKMFKLEPDCRLNDVYMVVYGAVCQQGASVAPNSISGRLIMAIVFITLMFLFVSYAANIVALLQSPSNQIKTLTDLRESKLEASVEDTDYQKYFVPRVTELGRRKFFEEKLVDKDKKLKINTVEEGMKKVREGQFAFHTERSKAYRYISDYFLDNEKCGLEEISYIEWKTDPYLVVKKFSPYKELIRIGMTRLQEFGIKQKLNLRYYLSKPTCVGGGSNFASATLVDTGPAIKSFVYGFGLAICVFIGEIIYGNLNVIRKGLHWVNLKTKLFISR